MDSCALSAVVTELASLIVPSAVRKIYQMGDSLFLLNLWKQREWWLLLSLSEGQQRMHLVPEKWAPSQVPSAFCMLLRKHLEGLFLEGISHSPFERAVTITMKRNNPPLAMSLIVEIGGKKGNIILQKGDGTVIRSLFPKSADPKADNLNLPPKKPESRKYPIPLSSAEEFQAIVGENTAEDRLEKHLCRTFLALTSTYAREILNNADIDASRTAHSLDRQEWQSLYQAWLKFWTRVTRGPYAPVLVYDGDSEKPVAWCFWPYLEYAVHRMEKHNSINEVIAHYYRERREAHDDVRNALASRVKAKIKKVEKRLLSLRGDGEKLQQALSFREVGELLLLNLHSIEKGMASVELENIFLSPPERTTIILDERLSPSDNAAHYFGRFKKAKRGIGVVKERIAESERELEGLRHIEKLIEEGMHEGLEEALASPGRVLPRPKGGEQASGGPRRFLFQGYEILAGKNPAQNNEISTRIAGPDDLWFHAHRIPSSHVLIRMKGKKELPPPEVLVRAASLAAYYSRARGSAKVPVDYTRARFVKKTRHMQPGMVTITKEKALIVNPLDEHFLGWLNAQGGTEREPSGS